MQKWSWVTKYVLSTKISIHFKCGKYGTLMTQANDEKYKL